MVDGPNWKLQALSLRLFLYQTDDGQRRGKIWALDQQRANRAVAGMIKYPADRIVMVERRLRS